VQRMEHGFWAVKRGKGKKGKWTFNRDKKKGYEDGVFKYPIPGRPPSGRPRHESKKPDAMFAEMIRLWSNPGDHVLDPFVGGGTTAFAARAERRTFVCFEKSRQWYDEARLHLIDAPAPSAVDQLAQIADQ
jgi:DNA modification methylase